MRPLIAGRSEPNLPVGANGMAHYVYTATTRILRPLCHPTTLALHLASLLKR